MALKVFVDFDGTITKQDVGNAFFRRYVGSVLYDEILRAYKDERISAQECFRRGVSAIGGLDKEDAVGFIRGQEIDPTFLSFVRFCREKGIEFHVVSDGLDFYIHEIFAAHGIEGISVFSNVLEWESMNGNGTRGLHLRFPYADTECQRCACCKRNILLTRTGDEDIIVYVGEGYSDRCAVQYADIVFAKEKLQTFCQQENISYHLYDSFRDVIERLHFLLAKKRLPKRLTADVKRREIFAQEP
jgi:2-hydroxy-3-keto-5-methylthiopentenyl-1-phosphate phosphatase